MVTYRMRVGPDQDPPCPSEDESVCVVTTCNRYFSPRLSTLWSDWQNQPYRAVEVVRGRGKDVEEYAAFPLYMYAHSGVVLSLEPFSDPWDSSQVGFVVVRRSDVADTEAAAKAHVKDWNKYLDGDWWGWEVQEVTTCDHGDEHEDVVDSCWGYDDEGAARQEGEAALKRFEGRV